MASKVEVEEVAATTTSGGAEASSRWAAAAEEAAEAADGDHPEAAAAPGTSTMEVAPLVGMAAPDVGPNLINISSSTTRADGASRPATTLGVATARTWPEAGGATEAAAAAAVEASPEATEWEPEAAVATAEATGVECTPGEAWVTGAVP